MSGDTILLIASFGYLLLGGIPFIFYVDKGRKSGKITPRLCATLYASFLAGLPAIVMGIVFKQKFASWHLQYWGFMALFFMAIWLGVYAGPQGAGWTGKWSNYVYPAKKKEKESATKPEVPGTDNKSSRLAHTWRTWMGMVALSEVVIFVGSGLVLRHTFLILVGIAVALVHLIAFLIIWHLKRKQLREKGWRF